MNGIALSAFAEFFVTVGAPLRLGAHGFGEGRIIPISGGRAEGAITGEILAGGADGQAIREDGLTRIHARYVIRTEDGALVRVDSRGMRSGPPEVMARLLKGEPVDPSKVYFMTAISFDTAAAEHDGLNHSLFLARGIREPDCVRLSVFRADMGIA